MDYRKIYEDFISSRRGMGEPAGYSERHHIKPRSLGGLDEPENLIRLSARDHYFAHCCLAKIYGGEMWAALHLMAHTQKTSHGATPFRMGRMFAVSRQGAALVRSEHMKKAWASGGFKRNRVYGPSSEKQKAAASEASKRPRPNRAEEIARAVATKQAKAPRFDFLHLDSGATFHGTSRDFTFHSGLRQSYVSRLTSEDVKIAKGWVLSKNSDYQRGRRDYTIRGFQNKDGRVFIGTAFDFRKKYGLDSGVLSHLINGTSKVRTYKGWRYAGEKEDA
jgi:hypothetical protein